MSPRVALPALLLLATGCTPPPQTAASRASAAALASCRTSTDRSFDRQNRYMISEQQQTDSPFSNSGVSGITTRGLTQRYDYDTMLSSCLSASGNAGASSSPATSSQPTGAQGTPVAPY